MAKICFDYDYFDPFCLEVVAQRYHPAVQLVLNTTAMSFEIPFLDLQTYQTLKVQKAYYLKLMI